MQHDGDLAEIDGIEAVDDHLPARQAEDQQEKRVPEDPHPRGRAAADEDFQEVDFEAGALRQSADQHRGDGNGKNRAQKLVGAGNRRIEQRTQHDHVEGGEDADAQHPHHPDERGDAAYRIGLGFNASQHSVVHRTQILLGLICRRLRLFKLDRELLQDLLSVGGLRNPLVLSRF